MEAEVIYDSTSGWIRIGEDPSEENVRIAEGIIFGLVGKKLQQVWLRPNFPEEKIVQERIISLRKMKYSELKDMVLNKEVITEGVVDQSGIPYQISIRSFFDDRKIESIRTTVSIFEVRTNGKWWQFWKNIYEPLATEDFIKAPDDNFIDE